MGRIAATGDDPFETLTPPPVARTVELMRALAVSDLDPYINLLAGQSDAAGLRASMPLASQAKVTLNWALLESWTGDLVAAVARNEEASRLARAAG